MGTGRRKAVKARVQRRKFLKQVLKSLIEEQGKNKTPQYDLQQKIDYYENQLHRM